MFPTGTFFFSLLAVYCLLLLWCMEEKLLSFVSNSHELVLTVRTWNASRAYLVDWISCAVCCIIFLQGNQFNVNLEMV